MKAKSANHASPAVFLLGGKGQPPRTGSVQEMGFKAFNLEGNAVRSLHRRFDVRRGIPQLRLDLPGDPVAFALVQRPATNQVDRAVLRGCRELGRGIVGNAFPGPLLERGDERVLRNFFGETDIAQRARKRSDDLRRLHASYRLDRAVRAGRRHGGPA